MINGPYYILPDEKGFKGSLLDYLLAAGYYRMLHTVFTTHHTQLNTESEPVPVFWLRNAVARIKENKTALGIRKKCSAFTAVCKKAVITPEIEALYALYHSAVDFNTGGSCSACMYDSEISNPFDSWMIEIRDEEILIAAGFFDLGKSAITGILNCYHPAYKKYSLGKYLMLQKIDYARRNDIAWYYTGYIGTSFTKFDYKLFPDPAAIEVFLPVERRWVSFELAGKEGLGEYWMKKVP
jgi:leucyl-tRNA---protein transferase